MKKVFVKIVVVAIMLILAYQTVVDAFSFTLSMTPSKTNVAESSDFVVTIKVSNLDVGQNGINALSGYLSYDSEIFEPITSSDIEGLNAWSYVFNSENGKITLSKMTFVKSEEAVFQITFKTKSGVSGKTGKISLKTILASNNVDDISANDISTTITVNGSSSTNTVENTTTNSISNTANTNNTIYDPQNLIPIRPANIVSENTAYDDDTDDSRYNVVANLSTYRNTIEQDIEEDIPYTGVEDTIIFVIGVIFVLSIIFYVKYKKLDV